MYIYMTLRGVDHLHAVTADAARIGQGSKQRSVGARCRRIPRPSVDGKPPCFHRIEFLHSTEFPFSAAAHGIEELLVNAGNHRRVVGHGDASLPLDLAVRQWRRPPNLWPGQYEKWVHFAIRFLALKNRPVSLNGSDFAWLGGKVASDNV